MRIADGRLAAWELPVGGRLCLFGVEGHSESRPFVVMSPRHIITKIRALARSLVALIHYALLRPCHCH